MTTLAAFKKFTGNLAPRDQKMPVLFLGHGSPINGIEQNDFSQTWSQLAQAIPLPAAVLVVSAHWLTQGTKITAMDFPETIHDFGGFPKELYAVQYPAPGNADLARETVSVIESAQVVLAHDWGLDHGAWTILRHMYPDASIPILQLSIDYTKGPQFHYDLAKELAWLRRKGVLIIGSGNMVHNLRLLSFEHFNDNFGFDWARDINQVFKDLVTSKDHPALINYQSLGPAAKLAIPTPDHYYPLLYTLGLQGSSEEALIFNDQLVAGSITMTSVMIN